MRVVSYHFFSQRFLNCRDNFFAVWLGPGIKTSDRFAFAIENELLEIPRNLSCTIGLEFKAGQEFEKFTLRIAFHIDL